MAEAPGVLAVGVLSEDGANAVGREVEYRFPHTVPGRARTARVVVRNLGSGPLTVEGVEQLASTAVEVFQIAGPGASVIDGGGEQSFEATFAPFEAGAFSSTFRVRARDVSGEQTATITLVGISAEAPLGAEPDIAVVPHPKLEFGPVIHLPEAPVLATRKLVVFNRGRAGSSTGPDGRLRIEELRVRAIDGGASDEEIEVRLPEGWDRTAGLDARAGANAVELEVQLTPASVGPKRWELSISSNDPDQPVLTVEISADVIAPPPCLFTVSPERVEFGNILPPDFRDRLITLTNVGTAPNEQCVVWDLQLSPDSAPEVTLTDGPIERRLLKPGQSLEVPVRVYPHGQADPEKLTAALQFRITSPTRPQVTVPIAASVKVDCLTILPSQLEFGTVLARCGSADRSFSLYNTCSHEVVISSFGMPNSAGQPAGGPDCPSSFPCPEYLLVASPAIPAGGLRLKPGDPSPYFKVRYRPMDLGTDMGAIAINVGSGASQSRHTVALTGTGIPSAQRQTDVFVVDPQPMVDVLLVIDNSTSMARHQSALASNLSAYLQHLQASRLDFNLAVITADPADGAIFRSGPTHPEAVLKRSTPDLAAKFAAKVNVGTSGGGVPQCLAQALAALSSPLTSAQNAGFLRNKNPLAVICITDSSDQSPLQVSDYVSGFWGIKDARRPWMFSFNAIGGFSASCPGDTGALADTVLQTRGKKEDICNPDWHHALDQGASDVFGFLSNRFPLTSIPEFASGSIEVRVDQQLVSSTNANGEIVWAFDPVDNSIKFDRMHMPPPGSTITVTYFAACYP